MSDIEIIICLILLFMGVPDLCRLPGRPALAYPTFVICGLLLAPLAESDVAGMLRQAGQVGFLLLLFEVGLEIDLPRFREFLPTLRRAWGWALLQYPVILALGHLAGVQWLGCFIACAAFTGCSVGMGYLGWKHYPGLSATKTAFFLGLFMSRLQHDGQGLEEYIAPISRRFLIPIFFFALGLQVKWIFLFSNVGLVALGAAAVILGWRLVIHRRMLPTGGDDRSFLLLCPNLTIVALAANTLLQDDTAPLAGSWMLLTGLFITIPAIIMLPKPAAEHRDPRAAA